MTPFDFIPDDAQIIITGADYKQLHDAGRQLLDSRVTPGQARRLGDLLVAIVKRAVSA